MFDHARSYIEKIHYIDAELAGHVHKLDVKLQNFVGVALLCLLWAFLPSLITLEQIDQQHFAKTEIGYIPLPLECHIAITSYDCVIMQMVILHDAM